MPNPILPGAMVPVMIFTHNRGTAEGSGWKLPQDSSRGKVVMSRWTYFVAFSWTDRNAEFVKPRNCS